MSALLKSKEEKRCPRCGQLALNATLSCPACGLEYSKLMNSSNKSAKRCIKARHSEYVVNVTTFPTDLKKRKYVLLLLFLGLFGAHNFYIGKYKTAFYQFFSAMISIILFALTYVFQGTALVILENQIIPVVGMCFAIDFIMWGWQIFAIIFGTQKYPVAPNDVKLESDLKLAKHLNEKHNATK